MKSIHDFIRRFGVFNILSHKEPDGDCVGSSIAMARYLGSLGKTTRLYSPGPFSRFGMEDYAVFFNNDPFDCSKDTGIIILDCSTMDRIGYFAENLKQIAAASRADGQSPESPESPGAAASSDAGIPGTCGIAVIDHHSSGEPFGEAGLIDPIAPSTTFIVQKLIEEAGAVIDAETAQWLLFGLCTDTGYFRHLTAGSDHVFKAVARLTAAGANPSAAYKTMYGGRSLSSRRLLGRLLDRTESYRDGRLLVTYETLADLSVDRSVKSVVVESLSTVPAAPYDSMESITMDSKSSTLDRDSDTLYSLLQGVKNAEAIVFVREERPGELSAGLRSDNHLDMGEIAKEFGGGGHKKAAGLEWKGNLRELKVLLTEAVLKRM